ncbi:hypothetical protein [Thermocrinis sp.]|jgi:ZIP family zinc transporter|uniref:ZIP family metal transporter n=1 Tax=Thermocrinis sp. TaxID=2024383 RepID=UPI002627B95C|nr:hypothetical protein [Thermocrinis sp.]
MDIWLGSLLLVIGTALGSFMVLFFRGKTSPSLNVSLSFAGGVMLTASFTSFILPAVERGGFFKTALGVTIGFRVMAFVERLFPHEHPTMGQEGILPFWLYPFRIYRRAWWLACLCHHPWLFGGISSYALS